MKQTDDWSASSRVDLNLFRVFEVVYEERNLTRAAEFLHLSQSAVSHALARLRKQIGDALFIRQGRVLVPTPLAEQMAPSIQHALRDLRRSATRCQLFDPERDHRIFHLNIPEQMEPIVLPRLVKQLNLASPNCVVRCSSLYWAELKLQLAVGHIDFAIEIARPTDIELNQRKWLHDTWCVMAAPMFSGELNIERYLAAEHVAVTSRRRGICMEDLALGHLGLTRRVRQHCQNYLTAALLVAESDYLLTIPRRYAELINRGVGNVLVSMPIELSPVNLNLYWSKQTHNEAGNQWLRNKLVELSSQLDDSCPLK